jgi:hypothetical protein
MKNFWKVIGYTALGTIVLAYAGFLFVLPNVIDLNQYKAEVQKLAQEQANLSVNFENVKIVTTPLLGVGIKADDISVKLPDNSVLFSADNFKTRIALPSLALLTVKVSCFEVNNPYINLEIENNKQFKVVQLVEDLLNQDKEQKLDEDEVETEETVENSWFDPSWIRIKVPNVTFNNYKILVNDLKSKHYLDLHGDKLTLGYFNGKSAKVKTYAELFSDENKNVTANIDINTFLPPIEPSLDEEDDPAERIDIPFINVVEMYRNYDFKANLDTQLYVRKHKNEISSFGHFNVENITLNVGHIALPESYIKAKTFMTNVDLDTNIYPAKNQNIELLGKLDYGKHPKLDMSIKTAEIKFNDMLNLGKAFLNSLSIPNELSKVTATGSLKSDCYIKTNFKKLKSNGSIIVKDGGINVKGVGKVLSNANINVLLDNNVLDIKNSSLFVNNSKITINGNIDEKSVADIEIKGDKIPLPVLFNAFAPKDIRNAYNFRSGNVSFGLNIKGELKKAVATVKAELDNLYIGDKAGNFVAKNKKFVCEILADTQSVIGELSNENFVFSLPNTKSTISAPIFKTKIADNNITIDENKINFNDKSTITYSGEIIDYNKLNSITLKADGSIATDDLIKLIGKEFKSYVHSQGSIPVSLTVNGNGKKQTLFAQALANNQNFITPVDFTELQGKNTSLQSVIDFKGNRIKIKKTGLYERNVSVNEEGNEVVSLNDILDIDGTIAGNRINLIKINLANALNGKIFVFPKSSFKVDGKAYVFGETSSPRFRGGFNIQDLTIPELLITLKDASLKFVGHSANLKVDDLLLNGSDIQVSNKISLVPSSVLNISNLNITSKYINVDKLMVVSDKAMKYVPQSTSTTSSSTQADIPVTVKNGSINLNRIISGDIDLQNTTGRIALFKNVFYLRNLSTNVFKGSVNGNISMNLLSSLMNIKVKGTGLNVEQALKDAANMKDTLSGTADFNANISLQGATYEEQMKSLKGTVDFNVQNGQFGPFGKLENLILAENIRESAFFQTALGGMLSGLLTIDTTHFSELTGSLSFENGICHIDPITSLGNILSLHIFGDFDLLENKADMKVRARMASLVSNLLGPLGAINPANMLNSAASLNVVTAKAFSIFCEVVPESEIAILPSFSNKYVDNAATKFQIVVRGDVAKPLTLVKSFKWLATSSEYDSATDYVNSLPEPIEGEENASIEETIAEHEAIEAEKQTFKYKIKHLFSKEKE